MALKFVDLNHNTVLFRCLRASHIGHSIASRCSAQLRLGRGKIRCQKTLTFLCVQIKSSNVIVWVSSPAIGAMIGSTGWSIRKIRRFQGFCEFKYAIMSMGFILDISSSGTFFGFFTWKIKQLHIANSFYCPFNIIYYFILIILTLYTNVTLFKYSRSWHIFQLFFYFTYIKLL